MNTKLPADHGQHPNTPTELGRRKGKLGESRIKALLQRAGWRAWPQPSSGAHGTRTGTASKCGDLVAACGEAKLRIEVKHYKHEPRTLQTLRGGCDVLAYLCSDTGRMAVFIDEALFIDLLAWSAETLSQVVGEPAPSRPLCGRALRPGRLGRGCEVDGEIARARLEALISEAGYPLLIQLDRLARALQGRNDRTGLIRASQLMTKGDCR